MPSLHQRPWVPEASEALIQQIAVATSNVPSAQVDAWIHDLVAQNTRIHTVECVNLNPAANTMNPRAEALLASGLGSRPSLGYPGAKYEMGLEAIERIEVIAAELAAEVFHAGYAEVRVASGALANLYAFMATATPGRAIIAPPAEIAGHVTHHASGAAGLLGLDIVPAPVDAGRYTVDVDHIAEVADEHRPALITIGGSLNLTRHPVARLREVADGVGAKLLFDAAHLSGLIAGGAWPNPLDEGAHVMTMSAYKSLGGPPSGLLLTNDAEIAERVDAIAFPGLTANFDAASTAALAVTLLDWREHGAAYSAEMVAAAQALATALDDAGLPVHGDDPYTMSHAFAVDAAARFPGGHEAAQHLRRANLLTSAIGIPGSATAGLRLGTNEVVRFGMTADDMPELAALFARAWSTEDDAALAAIADEVTDFRSRFARLHFVRAADG